MGQSIAELLPRFFEDTGLNVPVSPVHASQSPNDSLREQSADFNVGDQCLFI